MADKEDVKYGLSERIKYAVLTSFDQTSLIDKLCSRTICSRT